LEFLGGIDAAAELEFIAVCGDQGFDLVLERILAGEGREFDLGRRGFQGVRRHS